MSKRFSQLTLDASRAKLPIQSEPEPRYSLFRREFGKDGKWVRCRTESYPAKHAARVFGEVMAEDPFRYHIKQVTPEHTQANVRGNKYFGRVSYNQFEKFEDSKQNYRSMTEPHK